MLFFCKKFRMTHLLISNSQQETELIARSSPELELMVVRDISETSALPQKSICMDLLFENTPGRKMMLDKTGASIILVNYNAGTLKDLPGGYARMNGWNSFLKGSIIEASAPDKEAQESLTTLFTLLGKRPEWLPDLPGFVSPRILSQIINEAYYSLQENVSSREDIDTAMKFGTNYPYGPFEWSKIIGLKEVAVLLQVLSKTNARYEPSALLMEEAKQ